MLGCVYARVYAWYGRHENEGRVVDPELKNACIAKRKTVSCRIPDTLASSLV